MTQQVQHSGLAGTRDFAGPFLRFNSGTGPREEDRWTGSVLCLCRARGDCPGDAQGSVAAAPAGVGTPLAGAPQAAPEGALQVANSGAADAHGQNSSKPPVLILSDTHAGRGDDAVAGEARLVPVQLDSCLGWTFWRFDIEFRLTVWQRAVQYRIEAGGVATLTFTFWLPGIGQSMHWGYYSCNGMSEDVAPSAPERKDPTYLWRDLLQLHSAFPLHCLVGGGDQLYNDAVWHCPALKAWGSSTDHDKKTVAPWTPEMEGEATAFYLSNYIDSFSTPDADLALAQIPQVMQWDDHDIWDGYGSYEPGTQNSPVFQGLFRAARRFYLLFQQHTTDAFNREACEFLTNDGSEFHFLKYLGPQVALLGIDMRSRRSQHRIMPQATYELLQSTVAALPPGPQHLVVMSGIPLIFPKIPGAETLLGCMGKLTRSLPAVKNLARSTGLLDRFDQPEILDDLVDGWVADEHAEERLQFIRLLQEFATSKSLRVSIVSGDAHVGGVGRLYSRPKIKNMGDDPLFICQIISSAIVNAPPPHPVTKMLMRTNFASNVDHRTREKLVHAFYPFHPRTDKLIAQRNWCDVSLMAPPYSAPTVPQDPQYGGLRFVLRVEDPRHRRGYADETYVVLVPRHPAAQPMPPPGLPLLVMEGELKEQRREHSHHLLHLHKRGYHQQRSNAMAPELQVEGVAGRQPAGSASRAEKAAAGALPAGGHIMVPEPVTPGQAVA